MDFELTEEQKMIKETASRFAVNEMEPIAKDCDREERYPKDVWKKSTITYFLNINDNNYRRE